MTRTLIVLLLCCYCQAHAMSASAPCSIERAAAAGTYVWLLCDRKELFVSADDGLTWQVRKVPSEERLRAIAFIDSRRGFIAGDAGTLLATGDGGETWRQVPLEISQNLTSIHFAGELGWVTGWTGVILHSRDGGKTWHRQQTGVRQGLESIFFADAVHGWAVGWLGTILRTTDGGRTWEKVRALSALWSLDCVYFRDTKEGWAVGFSGQILRSRDGGVSWQEQAQPVQAWLKSVVFDNSGRGWIAGANLLLVSDDNGESWRSVPVEGTVFVHQLLPLKGSLWAVGRFGVLKQTGEGPKLTALATMPGAGRLGVQVEN